MSLGQIANRVDLPRSTIQRIVNALTEENLLIRATPNARVKLGPSILRLAANTDFDFAAHMRPHLETLGQRTGETVDLSIQRGDKMVFIDQITANHRLSAVSAVGKSFHMFSSAHGKAALALLEDDKIRRLLAGSLAKNTANTITNVSDLITQLAKTRRGLKLPSTTKSILRVFAPLEPLFTILWAEFLRSPYPFLPFDSLNPKS